MKIADITYSAKSYCKHELDLLMEYRSGTVNSKTVNSKFHLIRSFFEIFARFLSFHVKNAWFIRTRLIRSSTNSK